VCRSGRRPCRVRTRTRASTSPSCGRRCAPWDCREVRRSTSVILLAPAERHRESARRRATSARKPRSEVCRSSRLVVVTVSASSAGSAPSRQDEVAGVVVMPRLAWRHNPEVGVGGGVVVVEGAGARRRSRPRRSGALTVDHDVRTTGEGTGRRLVLTPGRARGSRRGGTCDG
jgi:hypothetical protein